MLIKIHEATVLDESNNSAPGTIINVSKKGIDVATQDGSLLRLLTLQVPGGKPLKAVDILNGKADLFVPGAQFTS
jgi:methionyl-tRNA formyltransferase